MKVSVVHNGTGDIVAATACPDGAPIAHQTLDSGENLVVVEASDIDAGLGMHEISLRLNKLVSTSRVDIATGELKARSDKTDYNAVSVDLAHPTVDVFVEFMQYVADNNLWKQMSEAWHAQGVKRISMARKPLEVFRQFMIDGIPAASPENKIHRDRVAGLMERCGCGPHTPPPRPPPPRPPWTWPE